MKERGGERRWPWMDGLALLLATLVSACSIDGLVGDSPVPDNLNDPEAVQTPEGAVAAYWGALVRLRDATSLYVKASGLLSDELQDASWLGYPGVLAGEMFGLDSRKLPEATDPDDELGDLGDHTQVYSRLQQVRGQAAEALGLLQHFAPDSSPALRGHLYAITGYSELMLAELFCSGIPLSTVDYGGDYTLKSGSTTAEVLEHAVVLFDSSLALSADSARVLNLARIGRARALLGLGRFAEAAQAVAGVPDGFRYEIGYTAAGGTGANFARVTDVKSFSVSVADREGGNGLPFRSSGDPRTSVTAIGRNTNGAMLYLPTKYSRDGSSPIVLASGVEARLIEAEAALQAGDPSWLATLNHLRRTMITPALSDTTDPGTSEARVDLLFRERAFWLFLTGHRQGDLRRVIRQYGRVAQQVYPTGAYVGGAFYGNDVTAPIPAAERVSNSLFTGCKHRGA